MLTRKIAHYHYGDLSFDSLRSPDVLKGRFYLSIPALPAFTEEKTLLSAFGALTLRVLCRSYTDETPDMQSLRLEECFHYNDKNEWILEAECRMRTADGAGEGTYAVRLPLSAPFASGALGFVFDGAWLRFVKDGEVLNENSGLDTLAPISNEVFIDPILDGIAIAPIGEISVSYTEKTSDTPMDLFYPPMWNTSIGDVMTFAHDGTYHVVYLLDRRHHGSRGGLGAHYLAHLMTRDLTNWVEEEPLLEIKEPWQSYGTGTMLYHRGKYYMTFGYHSERYTGACEKIEPSCDEVTNAYHPLSIQKILDSGAIPAGASFAVSEDGVHFTPSDVLFHPGRNPSAYVNEKGEIDLFIGYGTDGCFTAKHLGAPTYPSVLSFPYARKALMKNTTECPSFFTFNGYKYLIVGFTGYYRTKRPGDNEYIDASAIGECIYDGLGVPMVASLGERRIMAGWLPGTNGWGGAMMQRELIAEEGGTLGMKWVPELIPVPQSEDLWEGCSADAPLPLPEKTSCSATLDIDPQAADAVDLVFSSGEGSCVLHLDLLRERASFLDAKGDEIPTAAEQLAAFGDSIDVYVKAKLLNIPRHAHNYTLSNIKGIKEPFTLRFVARYNRRMRATVLDVEIAERRTMISVRAEFFPNALSVQFEGEGRGMLKGAALHTVAEIE